VAKPPVKRPGTVPFEISGPIAAVITAPSTITHTESAFRRIPSDRIEAPMLGPTCKPSAYMKTINAKSSRKPSTRASIVNPRPPVKTGLSRQDVLGALAGVARNPRV
jgi:hypothetical protein